MTEIEEFWDIIEPTGYRRTIAVVPGNKKDEEYLLEQLRKLAKQEIAMPDIRISYTTR